MTVAMVPRAVLGSTLPKMTTLVIVRHAVFTAPLMKKFMSTTRNSQRAYSGFNIFKERERAEENVFIHQYENAHIKEFKEELARIKQQINDLENKINEYKSLKQFK